MQQDLPIKRDATQLCCFNKLEIYIVVKYFRVVIDGKKK
jgi:hypothetical protein